MGYGFEVWGAHRFSTEHAAQDQYFVHKFECEGKEIHIGVLSDGCTGDVGDFDYQPELGARWLVREFSKQAEIFYQQGERGDELARRIILAILAGMRNYQPRYPRSKWIKGHHGQYCDELVATLYGFIVDEKELVLVTSGDGFVLHNKTWRFNPDDGVYPCQILIKYSEQRCGEKLDQYFRINSWPIDTINTFAIASDGFKRISTTEIKKAFIQWGNNPEELVLKLIKLPEIPEKHDDITVVALAVRSN